MKQFLVAVNLLVGIGAITWFILAIFFIKIEYPQFSENDELQMKTKWEFTLALSARQMFTFGELIEQPGFKVKDGLGREMREAPIFIKMIIRRQLWTGIGNHLLDLIVFLVTIALIISVSSKISSLDSNEH